MWVVGDVGVMMMLGDDVIIFFVMDGVT